MQHTFDGFVGVFPNLFDKKYCQDVINFFETMSSTGCVKNRRVSEDAQKTVKDDEQLFSQEHLHQIPLMQFQKHFNEKFWSAYNVYAENFDVLKTSGHHNNYAFKIQKTKIGGGYHVWHYESCSRDLSNRLLTWILYLNDVDEGGETEFLYQHKRIKPKEGTLILWPAAFTHTHRGNPPISNDKYIVTGWVEF